MIGSSCTRSPTTASWRRRPASVSIPTLHLIGQLGRREHRRRVAEVISLEAAEAVGAGDPVTPDEVLDLLTGLVDESLVLARAGSDGARSATASWRQSGSSPPTVWARKGKRSTR
jgi:hypothetical protein